MALRAAIAGAAGLALGRASSRPHLQRAALTALAVAAVPVANFAITQLLRLAGSGGGARGGTGAGAQRAPGGPREQRRRQLLRAAQRAADEAAAAGTMSAEERQLLHLVMQPAPSRTERVRTIARVLEWLQQVEADPAPRSRSTQLVSALVVYELNALVDVMDYEELHQAFGGHPPAKGLAQAQVAALPAVQLSEEAIGGLHSATCCVVLPACTHAFHAACLDPWLLSKAVCPVCRAAVEAPPPEAPAGEHAPQAAGAAAGQAPPAPASLAAGGAGAGR
ncbi:hypothetical protein CHLNCDRAFT_133669 [Chlorella variabilis]|uniref:RING-type domain-containing protein n=1 Tax=Chlorella variabilis TaxID=554065 RepID=E1Z3J7_CHLVA|nr:hypothetical protein CHLNCDRAFT_133669 [Chlorella variabilis]EFN60173.1 hypothetical protein CHLNCDRAFT_133669 [Chlorella variabilis]|eukprot:XP_005852275.1 hypothetical protein CHLNCDRAFT_133669 [Chlorella variabilis]